MQDQTICWNPEIAFYPSIHKNRSSASTNGINFETVLNLSGGLGFCGPAILRLGGASQDNVYAII